MPRPPAYRTPVVVRDRRVAVGFNEALGASVPAHVVVFDAM
ncbi:MAG: hypothetical protein R3B82_10265 [Sandaracinaceae bacterium]